MALNSDIEKVIRDSLPEQVGATLRKELEAGAQAKRDLELRTGMLAAAITERDAALLERDTLKQQLTGHAKLEDRERAVEAKERAIDLTIAQTQAKEAEKRADALYTLVGVIFKNPVVKETVSSNAQRQVPTGGGYPTQLPESHFESRERTVE